MKNDSSGVMPDGLLSANLLSDKTLSVAAQSLHYGSLVQAVVGILFFSTLVACTMPIMPRARDAHSLSRQDNQTTLSPAVYYHFLAAQACMSQQNWDCARKEFETALEIDNSSSYLHLQLAELYALSSDLKNSGLWAERAAVIDPGCIDAYKLLGRIYLEQNRTDDAQKQYKTIISLNPADEEAYFALAMLQQQQKQNDDAIATLKKLLNVNPRSEVAWFFMGNIYMDIGKTGKARTFYLKALEIDSAFEPALINLALQYEITGEIPNAIETLKKALEKNPENYRVRDKMAFFYLKLDRLQDALEQYIYILNANPQFAEELDIKIGLIYYDLEQWNDAELTFAAAVDKNPGNDRAQYYHGISLERLERGEEARLAFLAVPVTSKFYTQARVHLGYSYDEAGDRQRARDVVREAIDSHKDDTDLYHFLASIYEKDLLFDEGIAVIKQGLAVKPEDENLLFYLGVLYDKAQRFDESIASMQYLLKLNENNAEALNFIGYSWADRNIKIDESEKLIKKAIKLKPEDGYITDSLGWVYFKKGLIDKAIEILEKAVLLAPKDSTIAEHLADAYLKKNERERALQWYEKAFELDPSKGNLKAKINEISNK